MIPSFSASHLPATSSPSASPMHRNDFNLGTFSARGCCLSGGGNNGTCSSGTPYQAWPANPATTLEFVTDLTPGASCCGSKWTPVNGGGERPAVATRGDTNLKSIVSHELGHVIVMERMGARTATDYNARLSSSTIGTDEECVGSWVAESLDLLPPISNLYDDTTYPFARRDSDNSSVALDDDKSTLTLEHQSGAAREGWADFYQAWLWNRRTQSNCVIDSHSVHDFDLDGDIDNNYGLAGEGFSDDMKDGWINCEGGGPGDVDPFPLDPLSSLVTARDWLDDVVSAGACQSPQPALTGRGSQYDWTRFWWDMTTDQGIPPDRLADMYVDMCPTNWSRDGTGPTSRQVWKRLEESAAFWGLSGAYNAQRDNGVDR